ncbi:MvaI/BcnI family restriction endonuclease [Limnobacter sp. MED105]|uniref:MvaI/BcnI family restriction endonuclease n=1 Tax=Limnobacter sp. MED105 TaxID=391597 RepID=UPI000156CA76|nr:MvaI/BcnI family restriction endonuclease [Limnobacter sp. MED105]EDM83432.1 hypothetical protein LMED105_09057 [Limnobacter sp. MED105]
MSNVIGTYDTKPSKDANLKKILRIISDLGAERVFVKKLSPNDNSKNQPYFGAHFSDIPFIPTGTTVASKTKSNKSPSKKNKNREIKFQATMKLIWFDAEGRTYPAPQAKLIYYPQYPEVRLSGFLKGSSVNLSDWMNVEKKGRARGRWMILGISTDDTVYAYLATPDSTVAHELNDTKIIEINSIFGELRFTQTEIKSTKIALITRLLEITELGWIDGQKLESSGIKEPYSASNAGGYTLEAELGIVPNSVAEPDFLGWEVKQFGITRFPKIGAKPTTLMTPEPNGGFYVENGVENFVRKFGYNDKSNKPDRINFGGRHVIGKLCRATNLRLQFSGYDPENGLITDAAGTIALISSNDHVAASWSFAKIMDHWKRKHAQAVYIPCMAQKSPTAIKQYKYGNNIELGIGTSFEMLLAAIAQGNVYYDPAIKLEEASSTKPKIKRRSQFRINHKKISSLYSKYEYLTLGINNT